MSAFINIFVNMVFNLFSTPFLVSVFAVCFVGLCVPLAVSILKGVRWS